MLIPGPVVNRAVGPLVTVRASEAKAQCSIVFNAELVRKAPNISMNKAVLDWNEKTKTLGVIFTDDDHYNGYRYPVHGDGGGKSGKAITINKKHLPFLKAGKYDPKIGTDKDIEGGDGSHTMISINL